jgi:excisionase family DNA binding protein
MLLIKLDKGRLKDSADLLGSLLMVKIQMAAFSRSNVPQGKRIPFYLYIDEFQNFATESFSVILSEARKYGLCLTMAHQTLSQVPEELRSLILGNTGIQVYFRVNRHDAQLLAKEVFEYSGYEVKTMHLYWGPDYWSLGEEWEHYTEALQNLPPRVCFAKHKIEGGIIPFRTVEIEPAREGLGMDEGEYREFFQSFPFGNKYLVPRKDLIGLLVEKERPVKKEFQTEPKKEAKIAPKLSLVKTGEAVEEPADRIDNEGSLPSAGQIPQEKLARGDAKDEKELSPEERVFLEFISGHPGMFVTNIYKAFELSGYKGDKLKESLIEKGLVTQEETREGKGGRLAKILTVTDKGTFVLKKSPLGGKGGDLHKYLQMMVKERAELYGWKAKIEEKIPGSLETVDVGLSKQDVKVAVEISSTSRAGQEIQNIRKCLEAGYDYVICVCSEEKRLSTLKTEAKKSFTLRERERIRFCLPGRIKDFLQGSAPAAIVSENGVVSGQITKQKQLLDTNEAAQYLGIRKNTLYEWILQRKIPYVKVGRLVKFREEELKAWLDKRTQEVQEQKDVKPI